MKSTHNERPTFSIEDFEKGLMLAGLILPSTASELHERNELEKYEKELKNEKKNLYFKRAVLAAEIAYQLHNEPTFGRIKFQKLVYLCEHSAQMNVQGRYSKQSAGPFDRKFMHSIEKEFADQKWFEVEKTNDGKMNRSKYKPLKSVENYKSYYQTYFANQHEAIQYLITLFRTAKTDKTEIVATLYACHLELKQNTTVISFSSLIDKFYEWSERKKQFAKNDVEAIWQWMTEKKLVEPLVDQNQ